MTPITTPFGGTLEFYPLLNTPSKGTVLICPGGGYNFLAEREGNRSQMHLTRMVTLLLF